MRLLIDLFACQSASRGRGLGRYAGSVTQAALEISDEADIWLAGNTHYADRFEDLRRRFLPLLPPGRLVRYHHQPRLHGDEDCAFHRTAGAVSARALQMLSPDIAWSPSPFEGWNESGNPMLPAVTSSSSLSVATVHDFIPLVFPKQYLEPVPGYKKWYMQRLALLHRCDLLVADSDATRRDALKFLGIPDDRIVTVPLAADPFFTRVPAHSSVVKELLSRLGVNKPFILFTGNADFRKNVDGMLAAFSKLPDSLRNSYQLVLTQVGELDHFAPKLAAHGISNSSVVVAGVVSDEDLRALYSSCALFVFPSLYEGFGIPLLEAMACGAPTIAGNNSSLPEVMGLSEALFDPAKPESVAHCVSRVLGDDAMRLSLSEYGLRRCQDFTWQKTAARTLEAMRQLIERRNRVSVSTSVTIRRKLAYVSPLPPLPTGIADYSSELLPHLSRYFDIDVFADLSVDSSDDFAASNFRIRDFRELPSRYDDYACTIYQFGNSPFHTFMIDLIEACPGVAVLHDFFLSNLAYDLEYLQGKQGAFAREIDRAHGLRGLVDFQLLGHADARRRWPINARIVRAALAIIAHSKHQSQLFCQYFGTGWSPRVDFVSQPRAHEPAITAGEREAARRSLGVAPDCLLICSFGILAATKRCQLILEGFAKLLRDTDRPMRLAFVGADDAGPYRKEVLETARRCGVAKFFSITGFVQADTYRLYLRSADIGVQLRTDSRGESSRTVLDCLANGLPTIINSYASLADHDTHAVHALKPDPSSEELAEALRSVAGSTELRQRYADAAQSEIAVRHSPALVAAQYRYVIEHAVSDDERNLIQEIGLAGAEKLDLDGQALARAIHANDQVRQSPRLLIDVTRIASSDLHSGIERVISSLIREFAAHLQPSFAIELFRLQDKTRVRALRYAERVFSLSPGCLGEEIAIVTRAGDFVLLLDSTWDDFDRFKDMFAEVRAAGGRIIGVVYDLIPIRFPHFCHEYVLSAFAPWLHSIVRESDRIVCISESVARDLENYLDESKTPAALRPLITFARLGSNFQELPGSAVVNPALTDFIGRSKAIFVTVGTVEPRKGHSTILEAFEILWRRGSEAGLIVIGREGWDVADVLATLKNHRELGQRLLFLENASDADVVFTYKNASANICASATEGFGLPIVEAALHGTPTIASDIPAFREIGDRGVTYFPYGDAEALAQQIDSLVRMNSKQRKEMASRIQVASWQEAAKDWASAILLPVQKLKRNPHERLSAGSPTA